MTRPRSPVGRDHGRPSLLVERELTPEERAAHDDEPRPGRLVHDSTELSQDQTDELIRGTLYHDARSDERDELAQLLGPAAMRADRRSHDRARDQRGGVDSDPLVRLFAFRAWGDRDRRWFLDRGVRAGDPVTLVLECFPSDVVAYAQGDSCVVGTALADAEPGRTVEVRIRTEPGPRLSDLPGRMIAARYSLDQGLVGTFRVSERERVDPTRLVHRYKSSRRLIGGFPGGHEHLRAAVTWYRETGMQSQRDAYTAFVARECARGASPIEIADALAHRSSLGQADALWHVAEFLVAGGAARPPVLEPAPVAAAARPRRTAPMPTVAPPRERAAPAPEAGSPAVSAPSADEAAAPGEGAPRADRAERSMGRWDRARRWWKQR